MVKIRRMEQASDLMQSCGLPDCDPAESDPALQRKLMANRQMGDKNFTAIINKYADDESGDDMGGFDLLDDGSSSAANKTNSSSADEQSVSACTHGVRILPAMLIFAFTLLISNFFSGFYS